MLKPLWDTGGMVLPILFLFVREPVVGRVKTRLAEGCSSEQACGLYRAMTELLVEELAPGAGSDYELVIFGAPAGALDAIGQWLFPGGIPRGVTLLGQPEGALEDRLEYAGERALEAGAPAVAFLGSDCPDVSRAEIVAALTALAKHPAALGPAVDGGFWLLVLRSWKMGLFRGIEYSQPTTCEAMRERLEAWGRPPALLERKADIDEISDLTLQNPEVLARLRERAAILRVDIPAVLREASDGTGGRGFSRR